MKILVIDDDRLMLTAIEKKLQAKGYEVSTLEDGVKALEVIKDKNFDLIITDIMIPGISGLDLLNLLKQFYLNKIPVILMSSLHETSLISQSLDLGAFDFIIKPIDFNELYKKIDAIGKGIKT
jgi:DNA-binding response OmpR family regulator